MRFFAACLLVVLEGNKTIFSIFSFTAISLRKHPHNTHKHTRTYKHHNPKADFLKSMKKQEKKLSIFPLLAVHFMFVLYFRQSSTAAAVAAACFPFLTFLVCLIKSSGYGTAKHHTKKHDSRSLIK